MCNARPLSFHSPSSAPSRASSAQGLDAPLAQVDRLECPPGAHPELQSGVPAAPGQLERPVQARLAILGRRARALSPECPQQDEDGGCPVVLVADLGEYLLGQAELVVEAELLVECPAEHRGGVGVRGTGLRETPSRNALPRELEGRARGLLRLVEVCGAGSRLREAPPAARAIEHGPVRREIERAAEELTRRLVRGTGQRALGRALEPRGRELGGLAAVEPVGYLRRERGRIPQRGCVCPPIDSASSERCGPAACSTQRAYATCSRARSRRESPAYAASRRRAWRKANESPSGSGSGPDQSPADQDVDALGPVRDLERTEAGGREPPAGDGGIRVTLRALSGRSSIWDA